MQCRNQYSTVSITVPYLLQRRIQYSTDLFHYRHLIPARLRP
jgi:hypothetical protein